MMTNDEHVMETFGPLDDFDQGDYTGILNSEGHYYATLRDFEELIAEYGTSQVLRDMDVDTVVSLQLALEHLPDVD